MAEPITVVINNCNLLAWPKAMVREIESFQGLAELIIVDNGSTYEPLLDYYRSLQHRVIYLENIGHTAPWTEAVKSRVKTDFYAVTDPDLDLKDTPKNCLLHLADCLRRYPQAGKIGLGLTFDEVPPESPYFFHVNNHEKRYWELPLYDGLVRQAPVDTTFAVYHKALVDEYRVCGGRTDRPYTARHIPWSLVRVDAEFQYYLEHANNSSSYKGFVQAHRRKSGAVAGS